MKLTKSKLKDIIKTEIKKVVSEGLEDSEEGSRHYQTVKRKERILKKAIKDGLTFDQVQDKYTEFYDLDPEYYKHLKTEKPGEALEEELDDMSSEPIPRPQAHIDLENIMISIKDAYDAQPSNEEKEQLETYLLKNIMDYVKIWREERAQENIGDLK